MDAAKPFNALSMSTAEFTANAPVATAAPPTADATAAPALATVPSPLPIPDAAEDSLPIMPVALLLLSATWLICPEADSAESATCCRDSPVSTDCSPSVSNGSASIFSTALPADTAPVSTSSMASVIFPVLVLVSLAACSMLSVMSDSICSAAFLVLVLASFRSFGSFSRLARTSKTTSPSLLGMVITSLLPTAPLPDWQGCSVYSVPVPPG